MGMIPAPHFHTQIPGKSPLFHLYPGMSQCSNSLELSQPAQRAQLHPSPDSGGLPRGIPAGKQCFLPGRLLPGSPLNSSSTSLSTALFWEKLFSFFSSSEKPGSGLRNIQLSRLQRHGSQGPKIREPALGRVQISAPPAARASKFTHLLPAGTTPWKGKKTQGIC